ncbi:hypothetical protein BASA50_009153 [Batrachochytrium salamandrivorans]|uniref:non-specific serine/threonine protein kinase n=1 Tax=Batrachochytrium salamandrivorans TaxID=1357716 RepID=A0ABQ8F583_9FUNG|nr:hypothetical protein BASA50_009153 [Batrachochytrium salamandrivorans]
MDRHRLLRESGISDKSGASSSTGSKSKKVGRLLQRLGSMNKYKPFQESGTPGQSDISDENGASSSTGSKSKKAGRLLQRLRSMNKHGPLRESDIPDESDASSSADTKPKKVCKDEHGIQNPSKPSSQQQSQPGSQPSTSHDSFQSNEVLLPNYVEKSKVESYYQSQNPEQYNAFVEEETKYFGSEYLIEKKLGKEQYGAIYLAIRKSNGMKVTCKSIPKPSVDEYAVESTPPPRCHISNPLSRPKDQPAAQCMSPRPSKLYVPHEVRFQMYLSRPGHENPYVLRVLDYFILKDKFMLIMDYLGKSWMSLLSYIKEKILLDIDEVRIIIKEVINAVINLKQQGVFHNDLHGWKKRKLLQLKSLDPPSTVPEYEAGIDELRSMQRIGQLISRLLTGIRLYKDDFNYGELMREIILPDPDPSLSELKEKAIHLVDILVSRDPKQMPSFEAILKHPFFD